MEIYGRHIGFMRTVGAQIKITEICPDKKIDNLDTLLQSDATVSMPTAAKIICILNEGYETNKAFIEEGYKARPITYEQILALPDNIFGDLFTEAVEAYAGEKPTVEAEPVKKTKDGKKVSA